MKLLRDCAIVALIVGGIYSWRRPPAPRPDPAVPGATLELAMPSARPFSHEKLGSSLLAVREDAADGEARLAGRPRREQALGTKPRLLGRPAVDMVARGAPAALPGERSPWADRLREPWALAAVVALFIVLYAALTGALARGPGGRGFTHD